MPYITVFIPVIKNIQDVSSGVDEVVGDIFGIYRFNCNPFVDEGMEDAGCQVSYPWDIMAFNEISPDIYYKIL